MKNYLSLLASLALLLVTSCGAADAAVGTWKLDGAASRAANQEQVEASMQQVPEAMRAGARAMVESTFAKMAATLVLAEDGSLSGDFSMPNPMGESSSESLTGTWTRSGDTVSMTSKSSTTGLEDTQTATVDANTLTARMTQGGETLHLVFSRQ